MITKGLTMTIVFEAESANYGESIGNIAALKKMVRNRGEQYTYISRQALTYNMREQLHEPIAGVSTSGSGDKKVIQYIKEATIDKFMEVDFFGYLKTEKNTNGLKRSAKVRVSNAISLDTYKGDLDFLTNKGLADRINENMNIAQSEIHKSLYKYTVVVDLDEIGIDNADEENKIELPNNEKNRRVNKLLDVISTLYRDIRGRREDLKPLFIIGGVYDIKNPFFQNIVDVKENNIDFSQIRDGVASDIAKDTQVGIVKGKFQNGSIAEEELQNFHVTSISEFFNLLKKKVTDYYESN